MPRAANWRITLANNVATPRPMPPRITAASPAFLPDYAFIRSAGGDEIYMHRNALIGAKFADLTVGHEARYFIHDAEGEKGPQASTVEKVGKHHPPPTES